MKTLLKYIISFSMILLLLVSTLQFSLYKMECLMSGNTKISLTDFEDCNKSTKEGSISQKCCDFNEATFDFDYDSKINPDEIKNFNVSTLILNLPYINIKPVLAKADFNFHTNLPPPSGYDLLKVVQVFRL